ncbi:MAG: hypothetical protein HGA45_05310 [Chloroflexales bacterium]|nr:hypothetical protein [Chloroflexales bacterium]
MGDLWLAWQTGWYMADPGRRVAGIPTGWGALTGAEPLAAGTFLGLGSILGVVGAFAGLGLTRLPGLFHRGGPAGPAVQP